MRPALHTNEERARLFATAAHAAVGQTRRYTGEPYIEHPARVAELVRPYLGHNSAAMQAAWLHDVVEDTQVDQGLILDEFGPVVSSIVWALTDVPREHGNRALRKRADLARLSNGPAEVQAIKVADLIDNTASILMHDRAFAKVYLREKKELLPALSWAPGDLLRQAWGQVNAGLRELEDAAEVDR